MPPKNAGALMHHILTERMRRQGALYEALNAAAGPRPDAELEDSGSVRMTETRIYVGLNDGETRKQEYETGHYLVILKEICRENHVAFSVDIEEGGYYHEDGEYTEETSLALLLIGAEADVVQKIAEELCARFHQESVLVTEDRIVGRFISAKP